jgi:hypothetical protein
MRDHGALIAKDGELSRMPEVAAQLPAVPRHVAPPLAVKGGSPRLEAGIRLLAHDGPSCA